MDAQVGDGFERIAAQQIQIERAGQHAANQVGLGPGRSLFGRRGAKQRTHAQLGRLRPTLSAAVACRRRVEDPGRFPVHLQLEQIAKFRRGRLRVRRGRGFGFA